MPWFAPGALPRASRSDAHMGTNAVSCPTDNQPHKTSVQSVPRPGGESQINFSRFDLLPNHVTQGENAPWLALGSDDQNLVWVSLVHLFTCPLEDGRGGWPRSGTRTRRYRRRRRLMSPNVADLGATRKPLTRKSAGRSARARTCTRTGCSRTLATRSRTLPGTRWAS
jgi:hypothetical protein